MNSQKKHELRKDKSFNAQLDKMKIATEKKDKEKEIPGRKASEIKMGKMNKGSSNHVR